MIICIPRSFFLHLIYYLFLIDVTKGQLISKWFFGVVDFLQKTNENKSTWGIIAVKSNSNVHFLEEIDDPKNHFEINWPLINKHFFLQNGGSISFLLSYFYH